MMTDRKRHHVASSAQDNASASSAGNSGGKQKGRGCRLNIANIIAIILLAAGAVLLFLPLAMGALNQTAMDKETAKVEALYPADADNADEASSAANSNATADDSQSDNEAAFKTLAAAKRQLERYNKQVASGKITIASDPFSFDTVIDSFGSQGLGNGLVGYIKIPSMNCKLPLYLDATSEHMLKGAAVVAGSSAPLGETTGNCVIAAHRGYGSAAMFRDIETPVIGDKVIVCTLWEKLSYTVVNTKVIRPTDTEAVGVQQGRDMVTLVTCHPYGHNEFRYVVECERSSAVASNCNGSDNGSSIQKASPAKQLSLPQIEDYLRVAGGIVLLACIVVLIARMLRSKQRR